MTSVSKCGYVTFPNISLIWSNIPKLSITKNQQLKNLLIYFPGKAIFLTYKVFVLNRNVWCTSKENIFFNRGVNLK